MRVLTWNIHGGVGRKGGPDLPRILDEIAAMKPDIVALQEVDARIYLGRQAGAFETLQAGLEDVLGGDRPASFGPSSHTHWIEARAIERQNWDYGHALWSRFPLSDASVHRLPGRGIEKRLLIEACAETPTGPLALLSSHFGLTPFARRSQARFVSQRAGAQMSRHPALVLGDFNEWSATGWVDRELSESFATALKPKSWPAGKPRISLDRIYASHGLLVEHLEVRQSAFEASDHQPVLALVSPSGR